MLLLNNKQGLLWDVIRFLLAGGFNTMLTLAVYQGLLFFVDYGMAYSISWGVGMLFLLFFYPTKVFPGSARTLNGYILITCIYLFVFFVGLSALEFIIGLKVSAQISIFIVTVISALMNFFLMRLVLRGKLVK
ncbi:GtrA domain-containing protein [Vibrio echinoideorum]|uniref:hypothetical protein n=1 Tax=Vibrio echinoideorum TaxID=2100116 RepID=UPI003552F168